MATPRRLRPPDDTGVYPARTLDGPSHREPDVVVSAEALEALEALAVAPDGEQGQRALVRARQALGEAACRLEPLLGELLAGARERAQLRELADTDPATGVTNRRAFRRHLERELSRCARAADALSVVLLDLDGLKELNDELGHAFGDLAIEGMARACADALRGSDLLARFGGDEFVVMLPGAGREEARAAGERLRAAVEQIEVGGHELRVSLGVSTVRGCAGDELEPDALLAQADVALYEDKRARSRRETYSVA